MNGPQPLDLYVCLLALYGVHDPVLSMTPTRLIRPWRRQTLGSVRRERPWDGGESPSGPTTGQPVPDRPQRPTIKAMKLTPIELALVAELNLEMACAEDEAHNTAGSPQARRVARELAVQYRERARILQQEALHRSGQPTVSAEPVLAYTGPERRKGDRRVLDRRVNRALGHEAAQFIDRRGNPDRRQGDRRSHDLALLAAANSQST